MIALGSLRADRASFEVDAVLGPVDACLPFVPWVSFHSADDIERRLSGDQPAIAYKSATR